MSNNQDWEEELIQDFFIEFSEAYSLISNAFEQIDIVTLDSQLIHLIFRSVHSIKSNLRMVELHSLSELVHKLENILDALRHNKIRYNSDLIPNIILGSLEICKRSCENEFCNREQELDIDMLKNKITEATEVIDQGQEFFEAKLLNIIEFINPESASHIKDLRQKDKTAYPKNLEDIVSNMSNYVQEQTFDIKQFESELPSLNDLSAKERDLLFFRKLAKSFDSKVNNWSNSIDRMNAFACAINEAIGGPVEKEQIEAAVLIHNIGLYNLNINIIKSSNAKTEEEKAIYFEHPIIASNLLKGFKGWRDAATICAQYQEWINGNGFPLGLKGDKIHVGAKIISVCDFFEKKSMQLMEDKLSVRKIFLQTVIAINDLVDKKFDKSVVSVFNKISQDFYRERKIFDNDCWY